MTMRRMSVLGEPAAGLSQITTRSLRLNSGSKRVKKPRTRLPPARTVRTSAIGSEPPAQTKPPPPV
jgi:hypothetical protein